MPIWIVFAALGSIVMTLVLTWVLWRINAPQREAARRDRGEGGAVHAADAGGRDRDMNDGASDGGGDGGGD